MTATERPVDETGVDVAALRALVETELSMRSRAGYLALLLVALLATVALMSLWTTEPGLPTRTHAAFAALSAVGISWALFAARALATRRIAFVRHQVVAGRMATVFTGAFAATALTTALASGLAAAWTATAAGTVMLAAAIIILTRARRSYAQLEARRRALQQQLAP